jgi:hypothetical protein
LAKPGAATWVQLAKANAHFTDDAAVLHKKADVAGWPTDPPNRASLD